MVPRGKVLALAGLRSHEVLKIIFNRQAKRLAVAFGVRESSAARFLRSRDGTGARNPLDRFLRVIEEAAAANRAQSGLLVEFLRQYHLSLIHHSRAPWEPRDAARRILDTSTRAVMRLGLESSPKQQQMRALVEARDALDEAILGLDGMEEEETA